MQHASIGVCPDQKTWEGGKGAWYAHRGKLGESGGWNDVAGGFGGRRHCCAVPATDSEGVVAAVLETGRGAQ